MFRILWTEGAEQDLESILLYYLDEAGLRVAESIYVRIKEQISSLDTSPERTRAGRVAGTREYIINRLPYIAIVEVGADTVTVLNILHTARKFPVDPRY